MQKETHWPQASSYLCWQKSLHCFLQEECYCNRHEMSKTPLDLTKQRRLHHLWWARMNPELWNMESRKGKAFPFSVCKAECESSPEASRSPCHDGGRMKECCSSWQCVVTLCSAQHSPSTLQGTQGSKCFAPLPSWQEQDTDITSRDVSHSRVRS